MSVTRSRSKFIGWQH
ncbi:hypothetical protein J010_03916 [Cryptococcus neoformans]|nr:hypothetical protein C354_03942 [Cryptococcus neoformans var. grubii MW-RSA1955]OXG56943.1 hypothetical protein C354_03941 [Cryptococcus neoformans var. grubii MW-RSA1955]OXH08737.1 hypothetical protein J010_03916 [Cryptococcus neoformans var. grubii]OXH29892.1 hypothetical protein J009_03926 [Cryptococcus neoformans var. grubii]